MDNKVFFYFLKYVLHCVTVIKFYLKNTRYILCKSKYNNFYLCMNILPIIKHLLSFKNEVSWQNWLKFTKHYIVSIYKKEAVVKQNSWDLPNVPCSAERSGEGSVIFNVFSVPLFNGGAGKVSRTFIFPNF